MEVARAHPGVAIRGMGGIETGFDAAQFFLLGASTVQVCTGAMLRGYEIISELKEELAKFMTDHKFDDACASSSARACRTSRRTPISSRARRRPRRERAGTSNRDAETWKGDIAKETDSLTTN